MDENGPTAYAKLISEYKIGQPLRVESWMKDAQAALVALPQFQRKFSSRITESGAELRIAVFVWVCKAIKVCNVNPLVPHSPLSIQKPLALQCAEQLYEPSRQVWSVTQGLYQPHWDDGRRMRRSERVHCPRDQGDAQEES